MAGFVTIAVREQIRTDINDAKEEFNAELASPISTGEMILRLIDHWRKTRGATESGYLEGHRRASLDNAIRQLYGAYGPEDDVNVDAVRDILATVFDDGLKARDTAE